MNTELCRASVKCVAIAGPSGYCTVHEHFTEVGPDTRCAKCQQAIRAGSYARKRPDGLVEHNTCPEPRR